MRGDMQVRFGGRYGKTYCRKAVRRSVPSLRLGKGGGIIELAAHLYATDHVPYLLERIAEQTPHVHPVSFSFGKQDSFGPSFQQLEIVPLSSPALLSYLQGRGINLELAKRECSEARRLPRSANIPRAAESPRKRCVPPRRAAPAPAAPPPAFSATSAPSVSGARRSASRRPTKQAAAKRSLRRDGRAARQAARPPLSQRLYSAPK